MMTTAWLQLLSFQRNNIFTISHCLCFEGVSNMPGEGSYCLIALIIKLYPKLTWAALPVWGFSISSLGSTVVHRSRVLGDGSRSSVAPSHSLENIFYPLHVGYPGSCACFGIQRVTWAACKGWFKPNRWGKREIGVSLFPVLQRRKEEGLDGETGRTLESSASKQNSSFLSIVTF